MICTQSADGSSGIEKLRSEALTLSAVYIHVSAPTSRDRQIIVPNLYSLKWMGLEIMAALMETEEELKFTQ